VCKENDHSYQPVVLNIHKEGTNREALNQSLFQDICGLCARCGNVVTVSVAATTRMGLGEGDQQ
jgi:hypothetical protein